MQRTTRNTKVALRMNKRAMFFVAFIFAGVLFIFISSIILFHNKYTDESQGLNVPLGKKSMELYRTYQTGEDLLFALSTTAKFASFEAAIPLGMAGGFADTSPCGQFGGLNKWNDGKQSCMASAPGEGLAYHLTPLLQAAIEQSFDSSIPSQTFHLYADEDRIIGVSSQDIRLGLTGQPLKEYLIPADEASMVKKNYYNYRKAVEDTMNQNGKGAATEAQVIGIIAATSKGNPLYIEEDLGCAGIIPYCYFPFHATPLFMDKIEFCDCHGDQCTTQAACTPSNDDRFDPKRSIALGHLRLKENLERFDSYTAKEALAFAAAASKPDMIREAISLTSKDDPSFEEVAKYITPALIELYFSREMQAGYLTTFAERMAKAQKIRRFPEQAKAARTLIDTIIKAEQEAKAARQGITGAATAAISFQHQGIPELPGYYYLKPGFNVPNVLAIDRYPIIYQEMANLLRSCNWNAACLQAGINVLQARGLSTIIKTDSLTISGNAVGPQAEQQWIDKCEPLDERPLHDFLAFYQACEASLDDQCICEKPASELWQQGYGKVDIEFHLFGNDQYQAILNNGQHQRRIDFSMLDIPIYRYSLDANEVKLDTGTRQITSGSLILAKADSGSGQTVMRFTDKNSIAHLIVPACRTSSMFRICVEDQETVLFLYDETNDDLEVKYPVIRFAMQNDGTPPPDLTGIRAVDAFREEKALFLAWPYLKHPNVVAYHVYASEENLNIMSNDEIRNAAITDPQKIKDILIKVTDLYAEQGRIMLQNLGLKNECAWDYAKAECSYTVQDLDAQGNPTGTTHPALLKTDTPYLFNDEQIVFLLPVEDGTPLYVTVLPMAPNGMESLQKEVKGKLASYDDFPPPPCSSASLSRKGAPPNEEVWYSCRLQERKEDADSLSIEYKITDADGNIYTELKPLPFVPGQEQQQGKLPRIVFQDTRGPPITAVSYRILSKQMATADQQEMYDQTYTLQQYEPIDPLWHAAFIEKAALP